MLKINDLIVAFKTERGELTAVKGVSLTLEPGETLALVGESGCGKTVLCKSMLKILCERGNIKQGEIRLEGRDLVPLQEEEMIPYRGSEIAMVFQDPMTSLDPTMPVGEQIAEMVEIAELRSAPQADVHGTVELQFPEGCKCCSLGNDIPVIPEKGIFYGKADGCADAHVSRTASEGANNAAGTASEGANNAAGTASAGAEKAGSSKAADRRAVRAAAREKAIELMRLVEIDQPELRYGQMPHHFSGGMRQRIAIAIALAGQPKLLLADEPTTALDQDTQAQILALLKKIDIATIFITHDLSLVEDIADRVAIMQDGEIVETGPVAQVFEEPQHPYTRKLLGYLDYGKGRGHNHKHRILKPDELSPASSEDAEAAATVGLSCQKGGRGQLSGSENCIYPEPLVEIRDLKKYFPLGRKQVHKVLDGFSMEIYKGEILGIVGPSGCGKSTLARCIMEMYPLTGGEIRYHNTNRNPNWKQMIFQDSASAFNPRMTIGEIIAEPMKIAEKKMGAQKARNSSPFGTTCQYCKAWKEKMSMRDRVLDLMEQVELDPELIDRHPYEVSGGQRQRAAIARAISVAPELIVADEPISSLDISTQAQIIHLFRKLQEERNLTILLIAHDLPMVNHISDRIIEM